jgi:hypothetical protein
VRSAVKTASELSAEQPQEWIQAFYNPACRHSGLGYLSPINYERAAQRSHDGPVEIVVKGIRSQVESSRSQLRDRSSAATTRSLSRPH